MLGLDLSRDYILLVQHPVTEEFDDAAKQIEVTLQVLDDIDVPKVVILPNNDAGSLYVREGIEKNRRGNYFVYANLKRQHYLGLMNHAVCMIGNSSSGLLEAPSFALPAVNLGRRQSGRVQGPNVINADFSEAGIRQALDKAMNPAFRAELRHTCVNPYGDGKSAERILDCLREMPLDSKLLIKNLTY
jgi:GDP/UDP-N,N'-diacetylbacillosamine 2-epimerase (hydrolysing)